MFKKLKFNPFKLMINNYVICTSTEVLGDIASMTVQPEIYSDYMDKDFVEKQRNFLIGVYASKICGLCFYRNQFPELYETVKNLKIEPII